MQIHRTTVCAALIALLSITAPTTAQAVVLKSHFLTHQGMYWNFSTENAGATTSWVINGTFTQKGIGNVFILVQEGNRFLALREEWDGIYLCGAYGPDSFMVPEKPLLFFPFFIEFDVPITSAQNCKIYSAGENVSLREEIRQEVVFVLKSIEDLSFEGREQMNCAVIEKTIKSGLKQSKETWWTAAGIGPIKRENDNGTVKKTCALSSYRSFRNAAPVSYALNKYFPLTTGLLKTYVAPGGQKAAFKIRPEETWSGKPLIPYVEPYGDIYYITTDDRGLIAQAKFVSIANILNLYLPPDIPAVILPHLIVEGELHRSTAYYRACQWPTIKPWLDHYPEANCSSLLVGTEDVTTPLGQYKGCLKICLVSVTRAFEMQQEKVRAGFIWLAQGQGIVKQQSISMASYYLPQSNNFIWDIQDYVLAEVKKTDFPPELQPELKEAPAAPDNRTEAPQQELSWQQNSRAIFDAAVSAAPFFIRPVAQKKLLEEVTGLAGAGGSVTEDMVIAAINKTVSEKLRAQLLADIEKLRTK